LLNRKIKEFIFIKAKLLYTIAHKIYRYFFWT